MAGLGESLRWVREGTDLFAKALEAADDEGLAAESALTGWTGADIVAHVIDHGRTLAAALGAEIPPAAGSERDPSALRTAYAESAAVLNGLFAARTKEEWAATVSLDGHDVPAAELPWLRARELMVHAVDVGDEVYFSDLPVDFLGALVDAIVRQRTTEGAPALEILGQDTGEAWRLDGAGDPLRVMAPLADLGAWLSGREGARVKVLGPGALPELPPWL